MNADWRARAQCCRANEKHPGLPAPDAVLWTLHRGDHTATAGLWVLPDIGIDLRYLYDGEIMRTQRYRGEHAGAMATADAMDKREQLEAKGWRAEP
jgi:hypothetical protein